MREHRSESAGKVKEVKIDLATLAHICQIEKKIETIWNRSLVNEP